MSGWIDVRAITTLDQSAIHSLARILDHGSRGNRALVTKAPGLRETRRFAGVERTTAGVSGQVAAFRLSDRPFSRG